MRFDGKLKTWNAQRGFGFIAANQGGQEMFVHITAFPRNGPEPVVGEVLTFEVVPDQDGKKRAVRVQRQGLAPVGKSWKLRASSPSRRKSSFGAAIVSLGIVGALGWFAYGKYLHHVSVQPVINQGQPVINQGPPVINQEQPALAMPEALPSGTFRCDGRTYCSQMTSCTEAKFFLRNCPGTQMDGNHDGVPCEQQWCTSPFAK
jgi:cold shock CspA family protein